MNRCIPSSTAPWRAALLSATLLVLASAAHAQEAVRPFPPTAKRATLHVTYPPDILLNGKNARLSPGARIRGTNNLLVLSASLAGQSVPVNYVLDGQGLVHEVWLLNTTEARQSKNSVELPPNYVTDANTASDGIGSRSSAPASTEPK